MILRCRVVTLTRNRKGQPIRSGKVVAGDPLTIGRGAECSIYLPDPRVHLRHAIIRNNDLGKLYVEAQDAPIDVNEELLSRAKLRRGARILIGPYQITPEPATGEDHDFSLAIELVQPLPEGLTDLRERSTTLLSSTWLPKRAMAWGLFAATLIFCLALPLAYATSPAFRVAASSRLPERVKNVAWDNAWDPGPLSKGHEAFRERCDACHQVAFEPVPDRACVKCHATTGDHVEPSTEVRLGTRCAECHRDHKADTSGAMVRTDSALCVNCHRDVKSLYPESTLPRVTDFATDHPPFTLSVVNAMTGEVERWPADAPRVEASGLKFPHAKHLAPAGIRSPTGPRVLTCAQCHTADRAGQRFQPISMVEHCSECHQLGFEPASPDRVVAHGEPTEILTSLREFYSLAALGDRAIDVTLIDGLIRRPGGEAGKVERQAALAWADRKALTVATDLIETRLCVQCHGVTRVSSGAESLWAIQPVKITEHWLPGSAFDHKSHQQSTCVSCHEVQKSQSSADIAIPGLANCQKCHAGAVTAKGKVRSTCETCHSFHQHPVVAPSTSVQP